MGETYDIVCDAQEDYFELGKGPWWYPEFKELLENGPRIQPSEFSSAFLEIWDSGFTEMGGAHILQVGLDLYKYCNERGWDIQLKRDLEDDWYWEKWAEKGSRYVLR